MCRLGFFNYNSNSWRHFSHFARSFPGEPRRNILPIVLHIGHIPVVAFFGPVRIIFCVFLRPIKKTHLIGLLNLIFNGAGSIVRRLDFALGTNFVLGIGLDQSDWGYRIFID